MAKKIQKRALSVADILRYKPRVLPFDGPWLDSLGTPELSGCWIIWGNSGSGKTRFALQLCKYLTRFGKVVYNTLEEGLSFSFQKAIVATGMNGVKGFTALDKMPVPQLSEKLKAGRGADIIVIDSVQYSGLDKDSAKALVDTFPRRLFIFISHAEGNNPQGRTAAAIRFHADIKLRVEGYRIPNPISRYKDGKCAPFTIWEQGAAEYWGETTKTQ